ncbi:MAG: non-heme iron oxygenase ferredoxin subunit [Actinomycetes bacterium]
MSSIQLSTLSEGKPTKIQVDGDPVCVALIGDEVFAIGDTCSHSEASLSEGEISGYKIECWLHGAEFDLRTGDALTPPATMPVKKYDVTRDGETINIRKTK